MYKGHTVSVVVPAYNEEGFVGDVIETIPDFVDRIYAIDDCSSDGTWAEIRRHAERVNGRETATVTDGGTQFDRRVVPIRHEENRGAGGAIKTGYLHARDDGVDVTAVMAGDGQMETEMLDRLIEPIVSGTADYAKGNRLMAAEDRDQMPRFRYAGNRILDLLTRIASGYWRTGDPQSGYTAISLRALEAVDVENMYEFYGYCNDLLVKLNVAGMRVVDVARPITYGEETSHITYSTYIPKVSTMLFRNFLWRLKVTPRRRGVQPFVFLYALAMAVGLTGLGRVLAAVRPPVGGRSLRRGGLTLAGSVVLLASAILTDAKAHESISLREDD